MLLTRCQGHLLALEGWLNKEVSRIYAVPDGKLGSLGAPGLKLLQGAINPGVHQEAVLDYDEPAALTVHEAQLAFPTAHRKPGVVAIAVLVGRRQGRQYWRVCEPPDAAQGVQHDLILNLKLVMVIYVLPLAAGAVAEVGAGRSGPVGRGGQHLDHPGSYVVPADFYGLCHNLLPWDTAEDPDLHALMVGQRLAQASPTLQGQPKVFLSGTILMRHSLLAQPPVHTITQRVPDSKGEGNG